MSIFPSSFVKIVPKRDCATERLWNVVTFALNINIAISNFFCLCKL